MRRWVLGLAAAALAACAAPVGMEGEALEATIGSCGGAGAPAGVEVGQGFTPMDLERCDGSTYSFYGDVEGYCESDLTVMILAAGWCAPCLRETAELEETLVAELAPRGVRVVQVLVEDQNYAAPSARFCDDWVDRFDLGIPVLRDRVQQTQIYYPGGSLPAAVVIDGGGVIRHRELGAGSGLESLRVAVNEILGEAPAD